jgi:hypothetical protein
VTARRAQRGRPDTLTAPAEAPAPSAASRPAGSAERGLILMSLLSMIFVLTVLAALVLYLTGKETALTGVRAAGNESLYTAEGGAYAARAALMAYLNIFPVGQTTVDPSLNTATTAAWYANGASASQNPFGIFDYLWIDGQKFTLGASPATTSETFQINWASGYPHLKLQPSGAVANPLGAGAYTATIVLTPHQQPDPVFCGASGACPIHPTGPGAYEIFYDYTITSDGQVSPRFKREVQLSGTFSVQLSLQSFAVYALFTDTHTTPAGSPIWFTSNTSFNGPVHTNGEFRFAFFPTFTSKLESVSAKAWYNNNGNNVELATTENVRNGTRIDAPLVPPDPNPQAAAPANFTLGAPAVPLPQNPFSQEGVSIGRNPSDTSAVTTAQIASAIPELTGASSVPQGVYVPVTDANGNCRSDDGEAMKGGVFVQGDVSNMTMSVSGNTAVYTIVQQGNRTTTVTVDRANNQTTVNSNAWLTPPAGGACPGAPPGPATRTFQGVPKGWQGPGDPNATMIFVNGNVQALSGTLQQNEQTTIAAAGSITIAGNIQYQTPPNPSDPTSNPTNLLGLYASGGDIVIGPTAPNNVVIQAILMAGNTSSGYNSSVYVQNYNSGSPRGNANLLGGLIEKYYGAFGTFNSGTGQQQTGYGRAFTYDTRTSRGFSPPYFPTTNTYLIGEGSQLLRGTKPAWREGTPP